MAYVAALGLVLLPLFTANVPALVDYPNHLVRLHILAQVSTSEGLAEIYRVRWSAVPNLAMDVIVPPLVALVGLFNAGKLFLAAILILTVMGTATLHRALFGRIGLWPLAVLPFVYNYALAIGFLNFLFGIGLVPFALAGWLKTERWPLPRRLGVFAVVTTALYLIHIGAAVVYGIAIVGFELYLWWKDRAVGATNVARRAAAALGQFVVPGILFYSFFLAGAGGDHAGFVGFNWTGKHWTLFMPSMFYGSPIDFLIFGVAAALLLVAIYLGAIRMTPVVLPAVAALAILAALLPIWFGGNWGTDFRLVPPLVILAVAGTRFVPTRRWLGPVFAVGVIALVGARVASLAALWPAYDRLYMEMIAVGDIIEPGARVLPARTSWEDLPAAAPGRYIRLFYQMPVLAVIGGAAFVPTLFTDKRKQIVTVTEAYSAIDVPFGPPVPIPLLRLAVDPAAGEVLRAIFLPGTGLSFETYAGWPGRFDYVLLMDLGQRENPLPQLLTPAHVGSYFTLYRIKASTRGVSRSMLKK